MTPASDGIKQQGSKAQCTCYTCAIDRRASLLCPGLNHTSHWASIMWLQHTAAALGTLSSQKEAHRVLVARLPRQLWANCSSTSEKRRPWGRATRMATDRTQQDGWQGRINAHYYIQYRTGARFGVHPHAPQQTHTPTQHAACWEPGLSPHYQQRSHDTRCSNTPHKIMLRWARGKVYPLILTARKNVARGS